MTVTRKIRVLVVDDSSICRASIASILEADGDITVVGEVEEAISALARTESLAPDLITMDVQMPGKSGLEAVEQIMARHPVPILVLTAMPLDDDRDDVAFTAIQNGALDIAPKPSLTDDAAGEQLRDRVRTLSKIPVFQRRIAPVAATTPPPAPFELVAVTSGKGGIASVVAFVSRLPRDFPVPVVLFEEIPAPLIPSYTQHLARICHLRVVVADGVEARAVAGELLVLPNESASCIGTARFRSGTEGAFLRSVAAVHGKRAAAVVLAGTSPAEVSALRAVDEAGALSLVEDTMTPVGDLAKQLLAALANGRARVDGRVRNAP